MLTRKRVGRDIHRPSSEKQKSARLRPSTKIAQRLGVSEGVVRNRDSKLIDDQVLHIVGMVDPYHLGKDAPALIGVSLQTDDWTLLFGSSPNSKRSAT
jgi:DNA-binding Lrp family transcriptional regulator